MCWRCGRHVRLSNRVSRLGFGLVAWASMWGSSAIAQLLPANEADNEPEHGCFEAWR